jgi:hypothetical protein
MGVVVQMDLEVLRKGESHHTAAVDPEDGRKDRRHREEHDLM